MSANTESEFGPFHSSVNKIPSTRRTTRSLSLSNNLNYLSDHAAQPQSEISKDALSGSISVAITTETPLILGEQERENPNKKISKQKRCTNIIRPITVDDELYVPPTSIKGMISSAYEAVTNSRYRLFGKYDSPLTYRIDPATSTSLMPVRVLRTPQGETFVELLDGSHYYKNEISDGERIIPVVTAASLYNGTTEGITLKATTKSQKANRPTPGSQGTPYSRFIAATSPRNGRPFPEVTFDATLVSNGLYAYWIVNAIYENEEASEPDYEFNIDFKKLNLTYIEKEFCLKGYFYITTNPTDRKNQKTTFEGKKSERVFFTTRDKPVKIALTEQEADRLFSRYETTIQSYIDIYEDSKDGTTSETKDATVPNRFITDQSWSIRDNGSLAYAILSEDQQTIIDLIPIPIGRASYPDTPISIASTNFLTPPESASEASAADRLFGFITANAAAPASNGEATPSFSIRGRLQFSKVDTSQCRLYEGKAIPLPPLLAPKPSSARRFLTRKNGDNIQPIDDQTDLYPRHFYFQKNSQSLGRAAYPTHRRLIEPSTEKRALQPYANSEDTFSKVQSYILPGSKMKMTIRFEMLTKVELGILLWLLTPENLVPPSEQGSNRVGYLHLGMGKPLGYGAVKVEATECRLISGGELSANYSKLTGTLGTESTVSIDSYPPPARFDHFPWVKAFQRMAFGYSDGVEVRYMTRKENQQNNATNFESGLPKEGHAIEPRQLFWSDDEQDCSSQPICVPKPHEKEGN